MSSSLDKVKAELLEKQRMRELLDPDRNKEVEKKLARGVKDIPVARMISQVKYLQDEIMPRLKKKGGDQSADYKFFEGVCESLLYAIVACDRHDFMAKQLQYQKIKNQLLLENLALFEGELQKYSVLEDIFFTDGLEKIAEGIKSRADGLLNRKKGV